MGTIPRIVAHLDLDGAGIATGTALGEDEKGEFVEQRLEASGQRAGRRVPRRVPEGADGEEGVAIAPRHSGRMRLSGGHGVYTAAPLMLPRTMSFAVSSSPLFQTL